MAWSGSWEGLCQYLRDFTNIGGDSAYDTNGILTLLLALADNLRESSEAFADLPELSERITSEQAVFLGQLSWWAAEARQAEPGAAADPAS
jgi:hypothetical protein